MRLHAQRLTLSLALAATVFGGFGGLARADKPKLHLERSDVSKYPLIKNYMTLVESDGRVITGKAGTDFKLIFDSNEMGTAADAKPFDQVVEPIFVVIVAQVSQAMHDVFDDEKRGIKSVAQAAADIKGSKVALITYAQDVKRVSELAKPEEIEGAAGGVAEDDQGAESHLLDAIRQAMDVLNGKGVPDNARKLVVVFSDGIDVGGGDKKSFADLGKRANLAGGQDGAGIVIDTIGYAPFEPGKLRNLNELAKQTQGTERLCKSAQEVSAQFSNVSDEIKKQYVTVFQSSIAGDSKEHTIQVVHDTGSGPVYSQTVTKICVPAQVVEAPKTLFQKWWFWVFCVALPLLGLIALVMYLLNNRQPAPEPVAEPVKVEAPASNRTMALDVGALGKGPTVGWIVGMTGKYADRTFKLAPQRTVIGTSTEADVQIEDAKISRKHCEIRFDGHTYKIIDLGSTNGVVLNDKRTQAGDLVDGDLFRLGATEFKFKSIN